MTAPELIARLDAAGVTVRLVDGKPRLRFPPGTTGEPLLRELGDDLTTHRAAVLDHYAPRDEEHPGRVCGVAGCGAIMFHESAEDQFRFCRLIQCPAWRPGLPSAPDWTGAARDSRAWQLKKQREKKAQEDQPIPE
jgi:hypothetical protein